MEPPPLTTYAQLVLGPPGSGKTTYCKGMAEYLRGLGRYVTGSRGGGLIINLDPAAPSTPYIATIDVAALVTTSAVSATHGLGPNGALIYAFEYLAANTDWLVGALPVHAQRRHPGASGRPDSGGGVRLAAVNLVDAAHCADVGKWVAALLVSITVMFQVELPIVNVLSKVDLVEAYGGLENIEQYAEGMDLEYLVGALDDDPRLAKYAALNRALVGLVDDYSHVRFQTLSITSQESVGALVKVVDKANGYMFSEMDAAGLMAARVP
ncbi:hypothetical protein MMPV_002559 [Pyropia vietnamensis]